jgi:superfamily II RNA helicase
VKNARTSYETCNDYIDTMHVFNTTTNKKRKQADKQLQQIRDANRYLMDDVKRVQEWNGMKSKYTNDMDSLTHTERFIQNQTLSVCNALESFGFISKMNDDNEYKLNDVGIIASNIAEIHPLVVSSLLDKWNFFNDFSQQQIIGLISCFTDVKVASECRMSIPTTDDSFLKYRLQEILTSFQEYADYDSEYGMNTGIQYDDTLQYDIIDISMKWCECKTIEECKLFIQTELAPKSISIGDFTKAMLKITTIVKEWMNVFEIIGNIEALHKFTGIENLLLKYITTAQSLYV